MTDGGMMEYIIFTYGTLMKGEVRSHVLNSEEYLGDAVLEDHGLLELGTFPGIVKKEGYKVYGEVYKVSEDKKAELDWIEGEGYLYKFEYADVLLNGKTIKAGLYTFIDDGHEYPLMEPRGKWHGR